MYSSGCRQVGLSSAVHSSRRWGTPAEARPREGAAVVAAVVVVVVAVAVVVVVGCVCMCSCQQRSLSRVRISGTEVPQ